MDERKLAERLRAQDRRALEKAVTAYTGYVTVVARRALDGSTATREDLEEVVSDVFLALWRHADNLDPAQGVKSWLAAVARNKAVDRLRPPGLPLEEETPAPGGTEADLERRDAAETLWRAVEAMGEPDRALFLRHYYYGEKLRDVAADLGLKSAAAKTRLARGRKALRAQLTRGGDTT